MKLLFIAIFLVSCIEPVNGFIPGLYDIVTETEFSTCENFTREMETHSTIVLGNTMEFCHIVNKRTSERETCDIRCDIINAKTMKERGICHRDECSYSFIRTYYFRE